MKYLDEIVDFGGEQMTRGRMIAQLQEIYGGDQLLVDRYLQGHDRYMEAKDGRSIQPGAQGPTG